ncbi:synaptic vesicle glycoprotein 2A-like [Condylostylus longicornis]|uniref:synaptic vesicle glycoprotein 2A-like n=1 Tax=Condylostylus longicornis TaxID=2530218 RepID=UPI00244DC55A|nr:synaptic vesicle glycoprotein 2A-like [Condylostylus longicornis]XP_055387048.1 synaptic vesicle glycoprotein 2A-like [Condylostylus longicornis]
MTLTSRSVMSEESEEACLVNPRSPTLPSSGCGVGGGGSSSSGGGIITSGINNSNNSNSNNIGNTGNCIGNNINYSPGLMPYTDGVQTFSQYYGAQMNSVSRMGSGSSPNSGNSIPSRGSHNGSRTDSNGGANISSGRGSQSHESESGELIDYSDDILISQFHADAIKQTGCGKFQLLAALIVGLGLAGHAIQIYAVLYILPSAELEFCIKEHKKSWLGSITLLGLSCGALFWGGFAGRIGRRKTLLSCLAVSSVFSVIAAFMPTYGPFMMARFCAAAGVGGTLPAGASYLCEISPNNARSRVISLFSTLGVAGAIFAGGVAITMVPQTGQTVMDENKEHFSVWHSYLLVVTLPTFGSIFGLFWLPESPRWLLDSGREVEALSIYQKIFRTNRTRGGYTLTELELPGTRYQRHRVTTSVLAGMIQGVRLFFSSFFQLFTKSYARRTILMLGAWASTVFVFHGLTIFIAEHSRTIELANFKQQTTTKVNLTFENSVFDRNIENLIFSNCKFINCTFHGVYISHVFFENCTFVNTEFSNIRTSQTNFLNAAFDNVKLIDTDLTERHFINTTKNNTDIIRLDSSCDQDFDYNIFLEAIWRSNLGGLVPGVIAVACIGEFVHRFGRSRIATTCFTFAAMLCCAFGFLFIDVHVIWTGGTAQGLMLAGLVALTVLSVETYVTSIRCSALGVFVCGGHIGALISGPIYASLPTTTSHFAAVLSTISMILPILSSAALKDNPSMLL